jgi:hypothetical protein
MISSPQSSVVIFPLCKGFTKPLTGPNVDYVVAISIMLVNWRLRFSFSYMETYFEKELYL